MDQDFNQPQAPQTPSQPVMDIQRPAQVINPQAVAPQQFVPNVPEQPVQPPADAQEVGAPNYEKEHVALNKQVNKKRRGLIFVIILAVLVTVGLIGAAGYMYLQSQNKDEAPATSQTTETAADDGVVDETDIDTTTAEVDEALNSVDDSADFSSNDLSDDGIGL